jgi:tetratricopeptide (TPR) repeat protein
MALQQSIGDNSGYAENLNKIGNIHLRQGRTEEALAAYSTVLETSRKVEHKLNEAEALNNIGAVHHERGEFDEALRHYEASLALKREVGDRRSIARSLNNVGLLREARGEFDEALAAYDESLALKRDLGDQAGIASSLSNMGILFEQMGEYGRALECCEESLAIKETIGESWSIPYCRNALGRVRLVLNSLREAEALFREALRETKEQGDRPEECRALANLARAMLMSWRLDEAQKALEEVGRLAEDLGLQELLVEILYMMGLTAIRRGAAAPAGEALGKLREVRSRNPFAQGVVFEKHLEALGLKAAGRRKEARAAFDEAVAKARDIGLRGLEWKILDDAGRREEAREALRALTERVPEGEIREGFLASPRATALLQAAST